MQTMAKVLNRIGKLDIDWLKDYLLIISFEEAKELHISLKEAAFKGDILKRPKKFENQQASAKYYGKLNTATSLVYLLQVILINRYPKIAKGSFSKVKFNLVSDLISNTAIGKDVIFNFFEKFKIYSLNKEFSRLSDDNLRGLDFKFVWQCHEKGIIDFDERRFVLSTFSNSFSESNYLEDLKFIMSHPKFLKNVFLKFYKYEVPVLERIKCTGLEYPNGLSILGSSYWFEVYNALNEEGLIENRDLFSGLLESLQRDWKTPHLNWHLKFLKTLSPEKLEVRERSELIFALLDEKNNATVNYALSLLKGIYKDDNFDYSSFLNKAEYLLQKKGNKSTILTSLKILEYGLESDKLEIEDIAKKCVTGFIQSDIKIQKALANFLIKVNLNQRTELIEPYKQYLKLETLGILQIPFEKIEAESIDIPIIAEPKFTSLANSWEDMLYLIGRCIAEQDPADFDILIESINQHRDLIPEQFQKQIKPFVKQITPTKREAETLRYLSDFLIGWTEGIYPIYEKNNYWLNSLKFLENKFKLLFDKLKTGNRLPFLSTPSVDSIFIDSKTLFDRLLEYENARVIPDYDDLIIGFNRHKFVDGVDLSTKEISKLSRYKSLMLFALGYSEKIDFTTETLAVWAQVNRNLYPNSLREEFGNTPAKLFPSVVYPFDMPIEIDHESSFMEIGKKWNEEYSMPKYEERENFYYSGILCGAMKHDISYHVSMAPNYIDPVITRYISRYSTYVEVNQINNCRFPLSYMLEHRIIPHTMGWLFLASCLLFEKKVVRDLGVLYIEEYIALIKKEQLQLFAQYVGQLIATKYASVNRLIEFINRVGMSRDILKLQLLMVQSCILQINIDRIPTNYPKLKRAYNELNSKLSIEPDEESLEKIKLIGK
jgi:hypothetical protein